MTETRTRRTYNCRYADIKALGYRNLVNEYYKAKETKEDTSGMKPKSTLSTDLAGEA